MRKLDRYITSTVSSAVLLVLFLVLSLDLVFGFLAEMDELRGNYQLLAAAKYVLFTLPRRVYDYLPLAAFMGSLVGLGTLASSSELVVIRAAGVSVRRIVWSAMKPAVVVVVVGLVLGEFVAPYFERVAQSNKAVLQGAGDNVVSERGLWHREGNVFMHFNAVQPNGALHGISLFEFDDKRWLTRATQARRAIHVGDQWQLQDVEMTTITPEGTTSERIDTQPWEPEITPQVLSVLIIKPDNLAMSGLFTYARYLGQQGLNADAYWLSFWKKSLGPLATAALVLVAISFVFGPLRSVTMGFRVFTGIVIGLVFKYMQDLLGPVSLVFGFDPIVATLTPIVICLLLGAMLLRRAG